MSIAPISEQDTERYMHRHGRMALSFARYGSGSRHVLFLHGYGLTSQSFYPLAPASDEFTCHFVDLPYHGQSESEIPLDTPLTPEELADYFDSYLEEQCVSKVSIVAYSMGARLALTLLEERPARYISADLLAPDGVYRSRWYHFAVNTAIGRMLFAGLPRNIDAILQMAEKATSMGLLSKPRMSLLSNNVPNKERAQMLHATWSGLRELIPNLKIVLKNVEENDIDLVLHLGNRDKVILMSRIFQGPNNQALRSRSRIYDAGHRMLRAEIFVDIFSRLIDFVNPQELQSL